MIIRSSYPIKDGIFCATQGFAVACLVNAINGAKILNPINAALYFGGIAVTEKVISRLSNRFIPESTRLLVPIPIKTQYIVSYGLATYTTLKIMELVGLIFAVPKAFVAIGVTCSAALIIGGVATIIKQHYSFYDRLKKHIKSKRYANAVFTYKNEDKEYKIRIICNPQRKKIKFHLGEHVVICKNKYIVAWDNFLPITIWDIKKIIGDKDVNLFTTNINNINPLSFTECPTID